MKDFYSNLVVAGTSYTFVLSECGDGSARVGDIFRDDGSLINLDEVVDILAAAYPERDIDAWLQAELTKRLEERKREEGL